MSITFTVNKNEKVIIVELSDAISIEEFSEMRLKTVKLLNETGIKNYLVDMVAVTSTPEQKAIVTYEMGKKIQEIEFQFITKIAVILPADVKAPKPAEFLHTVELNRVRSSLKYVASYEEALDWFVS